MRRLILLVVCPLLLTLSCGCASARRVGKRVPTARPDMALVRIEGTRRVVGHGGDVGHDIRVVRVDGERAGGSLLVLEPGMHRIQLSWSRVELPDEWGHGLHHDFEVSTRWIKTDGGCCEIDLDARAGAVYALVFDRGRRGKCPCCLLEVPPCP